MPDRDIVDAIDELVDWQLGKESSGYDHNINQVTCPQPWCDADWHGLAITTRMRAMRRAGYVDPDYRYADDDSEVLCPGSDFEGEFTPPVDLRAGIDTGWGTFADTMRRVAAWHSEILGTWPLPDDPYDDNSSRGVIEMTEVDSLRGLRCQVDTPDAAYAEHLREHVRCSFFEEVARRYSGVQLDAAEIRTEYRQDGISSLVAWWEPAPLGGVLEGGHAHGREVNPNVGHRVETVAPVTFTPADFDCPPPMELNAVTYERAAYDTVTRRWVYRPRTSQPEPSPLAIRVQRWLPGDDVDEWIRANRLTPFSELTAGILDDPALILNLRRDEPVEGDQAA
ncbi:hypothetical protein [Nocardia ignorata]|uniref:Uncharacterized protein n=1 Tax=Nocardia ignorata TaxID=145285 RepID=A0A4R6P3I6_NOCIG|nr:hypothetical protein [Nocardia ignorata]TDP29871.1 hypothetical protein DFR75_112140 [Nocardia ignorata]